MAKKNQNQNQTQNKKNQQMKNQVPPTMEIQDKQAEKDCR